EHRRARHPLPRAAQALRRHGGGEGAGPGGAPRRVPGAAGAQRGGEDHHHRDPGRAAGARRRRGGDPGDDLGARAAAHPRAAGRAVAGERVPGPRHDGGDRAPLPLVLPAGPVGGRADRLRAVGGEAVHAGAPPFRRAAAAPVGGVRPRRRPGDPFPGRAHHRAGSPVAPAAVGRVRGVQGARRHDPAHHALHGRGGVPCGPHRHPGPRRDDRRGHPGRADPGAGRRARDRVRQHRRPFGRRPARPPRRLAPPPPRRRRPPHRGRAPPRPPAPAGGRGLRRRRPHRPHHAPRHPGRRLPGPHRPRAAGRL
ncbi:MAG: Efflux ABC transporter, ATP-binding protein, partial [uncultured Gemmatimonadetes bacterium]